MTSRKAKWSHRQPCKQLCLLLKTILPAISRTGASGTMIFPELEDRILHQGTKPLQFNESANLEVGDDTPKVAVSRRLKS
jgi:hypothetical protein